MAEERTSIVLLQTLKPRGVRYLLPGEVGGLAVILTVENAAIHASL